MEVSTRWYQGGFIFAACVGTVLSLVALGCEKEQAATPSLVDGGGGSAKISGNVASDVGAAGLDGDHLAEGHFGHSLFCLLTEWLAGFGAVDSIKANIDLLGALENDDGVAIFDPDNFAGEWFGGGGACRNGKGDRPNHECRFVLTLNHRAALSSNIQPSITLNPASAARSNRISSVSLSDRM